MLLAYYALDDTFIKSHHQHVICIQTSKQTSFELLIYQVITLLLLKQLIHLDHLIYPSLLVFGGKVTSLGVELVSGEVVSRWPDGWWENSLVAIWPDTTLNDTEFIIIFINHLTSVLWVFSWPTMV